MYRVLEQKEREQEENRRQIKGEEHREHGRTERDKTGGKPNRKGTKRGSTERERTGRKQKGKEQGESRKGKNRGKQKGIEQGENRKG